MLVVNPPDTHSSCCPFWQPGEYFLGARSAEAEAEAQVLQALQQSSTYDKKNLFFNYYFGYSLTTL